MELTEYEQKIFDKLSEIGSNGIPIIQYGVNYKISPDRPDREQFIEAIKKYIRVWNNLEFNEDYTKFRRIETINKVQLELDRIAKNQETP